MAKDTCSPPVKHRPTMSSTLRARLTLFYVGAFSVVLCVFSAGVYFLVQRILRERMDSNLRITLQTANSSLSRHRATILSSSDSRKQDSPSSLSVALEDPRFVGQLIALVDANGTVLVTWPTNPRLPVRLPPLPLRSSLSPQFYELPETGPDADDGSRGIYAPAPLTLNGSTPTVFVIASTESLGDQLDTLQNVLGIAILIALIITGGGGWLLAGKSLSPVAAMASATERITADRLDERLPVHSNDELGRLASRFNELLSRISSSFSKQRQFMAEASHELRTPLSIARTAAQVALGKPERGESEYREVLSIVEQQLGRLSHIVDDMFALTRADMKQFALDVHELYLDELIADAVRAATILAQQKEISLRTQLSEEAPYQGDERLLRQMVSNLLDNALKFTPKGGSIDVGLRRKETAYEIEIADTGCGIPEDLQSRVFERFFRAETHRGTDAVDGAGLGLPLARSIAGLHGGQITLRHSGPNGSTFCVSLPLAVRESWQSSS